MKIKILSLSLIFALLAYNAHGQANAGENQLICATETQLGGNDPAPFGETGQWMLLYGSGDFENQTLYNTTVSNLAPGPNGFRWIWSDNSYSNVEITNGLPDVYAGNDVEECDASRRMAASLPKPGETGLWTQTEGTLANIISPSLRNTFIENLHDGISAFEWAISNDNCTNKDTVRITRYEVIADAGEDVYSCQGTAIVMAVSPNQGSGQWTALGAGTISNPNQAQTEITALPNGQVTFEWTVEYNGCTDSDEVTVYNTNVSSNAGDDKTICTEESTLSGNNPGSGANGLWEVVEGNGTFANANNYYTEVSDLIVGLNTFSWTISKNNCEAVSQVSITNDRITFIDAGEDQTVCEYETQLNASPPASGIVGTWETISGLALITNPELYNSDVQDLNQGENHFSWTLDNGNCTAIEYVIIENKNPGEVSISPDAEICADDYELNAGEPNPGQTGIWTKQNGAIGNIISPSNSATEVTGLGYGPNTFRWTISNSFCESYDEMTVTNGTLYTETAEDMNICDNTANISVSNSQNVAGFWTVVNSGGNPFFENSLAENTVIKNLAPGANTIRWYISNGICEAYDYMTISNNTPSDASAGSDKTTCTPEAWLTAVNPTMGNGVWTLRSGNGIIQSPSQYNSFVTDLNVGTNTFRWTVSHLNCSAKDDVIITRKQVVVSAGEDDETCSSEYAQLNGTIPEGEQYGLWEATGGTGIVTNPNAYNSSVSNLSLGDNQFSWTLFDGTCSAQDDVIIVNNSPTAATTGSDKEICQNQTSITANQPLIGTGHWTVWQGGGIIDDPAAAQTDVTEIPKGLSQYKWTISKENCSSSAIIEITNNEVSVSTGDPITVCGTEAILEGSMPENGESGLWVASGGSGLIENPSLYNSPVSNLSLGINRFTWTISKGNCSATDDFFITSKLTEAWAVGPGEICLDYATIRGNIPNLGAVGKWKIMEGSGIFDDPTSPQTQVREIPIGTNVYRWTIDNQGCIDYDEITVINNSISAYAGEDQIICTDEAELSGNSPANLSSGQWYRISGAGTISNPNSPNTFVTGLAHGANSFRWEVSGTGCTDSDNVVILRNDFYISAGLDKTICESTTSLGGGSPLPGYGIWTVVEGNPGLNIVNPTSPNTEVTGIANNSVNTFRWTVYKNNCSAYDDVTVTNAFIPAYAGADQSVCQNQAILSADVPEAGSGYWALNSGGGYIQNPEEAISTVTNLALGANTFTWTVNSSNCISSDQVIVSNDMITASAGVDQDICSDQTFLAADNAPASGYGEWNLMVGQATIVNPNAHNSQLTNIMRGINTLRWTTHLGNCNSGGDDVNIINNSFDAYAGDDQTLPYMVNSTNLNAVLPEGSSGSWAIYSGGGTILEPNNPNTEVIDMISGENTYNWTVQHNDCEADDQVVIYIRDFMSDAGEDQVICENHTQLNANDANAEVQEWSIISGYGEFADPNDPQTELTEIAHGINVFRWTISNNNYTDFDDIAITYNGFEISAGDDLETCEQTIQLNAEPPGAGSTGLWTILGTSSQGIFGDPALYNTTVSEIAPGLNRFRWEVQREDCTDSDTMEVYWNRPPIAFFEADFTVVEAPKTVNFFNNSSHYPEQTPADIFYWNLNDENFDISYSPYSTVSYFFNDIYINDIWHTVDLIAHDNETGCQDTASVLIHVYYSAVDVEDPGKESITLYPNPVSNELSINFSQPEDYILNLYDLTGRLVKSENIAAQKTARIKLSSIPDGLYKFVLRNKNQQFTGSIQVIK